jgi:hypothetical protein
MAILECYITQLDRNRQASPWEKMQAAYFFETFHCTYLSGYAAVKLGKYSAIFATVRSSHSLCI